MTRPNGSATKRAPPEFEAAARGPFVADPVDGRHVDTVGDRVRPLNGLPCARLGRAELGFFRRVPADRRGIKEDLGSLQGRQTGGLGIPLVPADQGPDPGKRGVERQKTEVAGGEVVLFVIERVIGDVHLAIEAAHGAVAVDDDRRVVVDPRRPALEDRADHHHAGLSRDLGERPGGRARYRLGQIEPGGVFGLAKVLSAKKFGQAGDLGAAAGRIAQQGAGPDQVVVGVGRAAHLDQAHGERTGLWVHGVGLGLRESTLPSFRESLSYRWVKTGRDWRGKRVMWTRGCDGWKTPSRLI